MAIKFRGKDFTKLSKKEIKEYLKERIYMKPTATYKLILGTGKFKKMGNKAVKGLIHKDVAIKKRRLK